MKAQVLFATYLVLALAAPGARAADDPPADPTLIHDQAKVVGEAVKRDAKVIADAAKTGAKQVAAAAKEVAAAGKEGAHEVAGTAKKGAQRAKAAIKGENTEGAPAKPAEKAPPPGKIPAT